MIQPFWLVWNVSGGAPTHQHGSFESAEKEAKRLARANKGSHFVVLETVASYVSDDIAVTDLRPEFYDGIPF